MLGKKYIQRLSSATIVLEMLISFSITGFALKRPDIVESGAAWDAGYLGEIETEIIEIPENGTHALLTEYDAIVRETEEKSEGFADMDSGTIDDIDEDGYPELVILATSGGEHNYPYDRKVIIAHYVHPKQIEYFTCRIGPVGGMMNCWIYLGEEETRTFHLVYRNSLSGLIYYGVDTVVAITDGKLNVLHTLEWSEDLNNNESEYYVDGAEDPVEFQRIYQTIKEPICEDNPVYDEEAAGYSYEELRYQILHQ